MILIDPNAEIGLIPIEQNLTIWATSLNWIYLIGLIIWIVSAVLFLLSNIIERNFKNKAYLLGIIGWVLPNLALIGDIFLYKMTNFTFIPLMLTTGLGVLSSIAGIYMKISD